MKLHWSPKSPFVRKVMVAAHELGLVDRLTLVRTVAAMKKPNPDLLADNPLSKIPTLVLDTGEPLYGSLTICEYFDSLAGGGKLFPPAGPERWTALTRHALADGLLDVLILWRNEREKPDPQQTPEWIEAFAIKTRGALDALEAIAPELGRDRFGIVEITVGCCLSYADFRFAALGWREGAPTLAAWHQSFASRPSARATEVTDD